MRQPSSTLATLPEPARQVPVIHDCDLCVIGGSCTGVFAAVRAARLGARVALVEKQNCFGGTATAGLVNVWHTLDDLTGDRAIIAGLTAEVLERLRKREAVTDLPYARGAHFLNSEELKIELDELVLEHDITPLLHTLYVAPVVEEGRLAGIIVENKDGRQAIRARQFIDASGEGDLARDLGLPGQDDVPPSPALKELAGGGTPISPSPDPGEGAGGGTLLQPPTTCAKILGLNTLGDWDWQAAVREHGAEFGLEPDWGWGNSCPDAPDLQMRADNHLFGVDGSRATDLTRAEIEGRRKVRALLDIIRTYGPPSAAVVLADLAAAVGIRETARLAASYRLTGEDILYGRRFDDAIANGTYPVDIHHANGPGLTFYYLDGQKRVVRERGHEGELSRWREETSENPSCYQIPLRCLVPSSFSSGGEKEVGGGVSITPSPHLGEGAGGGVSITPSPILGEGAGGGVPNLLLAGRMLDADQVAFSAVRVMVNLNQTGEAAGVAAFVALDSGLSVQEVPASRVRELLTQGGSLIL